MRVPAVLACLTMAFLAVGCSPGASGAHRQVVLAVASGFYQTGPGTTSEILDIGLPTLSNISAHPVRLTGVRLAGTSRAVHIRDVTAFRLGTGGGIGLAT